MSASDGQDALEARLARSRVERTPAVLELRVQAGVVRLDEDGYQVPDLYRHGLDMPRPGPR